MVRVTLADLLALAEIDLDEFNTFTCQNDEQDLLHNELVRAAARGEPGCV